LEVALLEELEAPALEEDLAATEVPEVLEGFGIEMPT
jgi:hypothetical protein